MLTSRHAEYSLDTKLLNPCEKILSNFQLSHIIGLSLVREFKARYAAGITEKLIVI